MIDYPDVGVNTQSFKIATVNVFKKTEKNEK